MSWLEDLSGELYARGVTRRDRVRIVAELSDHIACDPGCEDRLGDPHTLAMSFADELATARARTSAFAAFAALAVAAVVLVISQITLGRFAHYPGYSNGISMALFFPALLGALAALAVGFAMGAFEAHAEHSLLEGIQRGGFEGVAAAIGFVALGRAIGTRPAQLPAPAGASTSRGTPGRHG